MSKKPKTIIVIVLAFVLILIWVTAGQPVGTDSYESLPEPGDPAQVPVEGEEAAPIVLERSGWKWEVAPKARYSSGVCIPAVRSARYCGSFAGFRGGGDTEPRNLPASVPAAQ